MGLSSLTANTLSNTPTASLATCSKVAKRQTNPNFPSADLLVVWKFMAMTALFVQIHERLRQSIRGVLDPIIYNPIKKLLKTDGKKSAQVREAGVSRRLWHRVACRPIGEGRPAAGGAAARHIPLTRLLFRCRGDNMPSCPIPSQDSRTLVLMWPGASAS